MLAAGTRPMRVIASRVCGRAMIVSSSQCNRSTIGFEVAAGATTICYAAALSRQTAPARDHRRDAPARTARRADAVVVEGFIDLAAPKGMPAPIVKELETDVMAVARLPGVAARILQLGLIRDGSSGAAFRARITRDIKKYTAVARPRISISISKNSSGQVNKVP